MYAAAAVYAYIGGIEQGKVDGAHVLSTFLMVEAEDKPQVSKAGKHQKVLSCF